MKIIYTGIKKTTKHIDGTVSTYENALKFKAEVLKLAEQWEKDNHSVIYIEDGRNEQCHGELWAYYLTDGDANKHHISKGKSTEVKNALAEFLGSDHRVQKSGNGGKTVSGKAVNAETALEKARKKYQTARTARITAETAERNALTEYIEALKKNATARKEMTAERIEKAETAVKELSDAELLAIVRARGIAIA